MNDGRIESCGEVLLAHASLYVLGEKWGVNSLKLLVLSKLHQTLSTLRLDAWKVQEIIDLARYMYLDSSTPDLETDIDGLRKLISLYMAANVEIISEHTSFMPFQSTLPLFLEVFLVPKDCWAFFGGARLNYLAILYLELFGNLPTMFELERDERKWDSEGGR
jgi:hypothetical protein